MTTILAVDDSATMRKCLEITFAGTEFNLVAVASAQEALEKVKTIQPDLVIADVSLPPNDGYELCSTIKLAAPGLPVLLLSSKHNPFDPGRGAQADDHIDKPFDSQIMQDRARGLVSAEGRAAQAPAAPVERPQVAPAVAKPVAMPERAPASKIPAPRRKRPTPAMMANPLNSPQAAMRRTVPFAMPGAAKRGPSPADALRRATPERIQAPVETRARTQPQVPSPETRPSMNDTMPGVKGPPETLETPTPRMPGPRSPEPPPVREPAAPPAPEPAALQPRAAAPKPAAPAAPQQAAQPAATPAGAVVVPAPVVADLETKLEGLGLTKEQMEGVLSLSRELVEQVVWEVVPTLAETLIKEEIRRLTSD